MATDQGARWSGYGAAKDEMPLGGYATLVAVFGAALTGFLAWATKNRRLPDRLSLGDAALLGVATQKLTRLVGHDFVTSPLRAPFVEYQESSIPGEVLERSRGHGLRRAVGDLLTCEFCLAPWVAGALFATHVIDPRVGRFVAGVFATVAVSDFLNHAYLEAAKHDEPSDQPRTNGSRSRQSESRASTSASSAPPTSTSA